MPDGGLSASTVIPAVGGLLGGMGGGSSPAGSTTTTQSPWAGVMPYLLGRDATPDVTNPDGTITKGQSAIPGVFDSAMKQYQGSQWTPQMQTLADNYGQNLAARNDQGQLYNSVGLNLLAGNNNAQINGIKGVTSSAVDPTQAFSSFGAADPTSALAQSLSGTPNNPYLASMAQGLTNLSNQNLQQNVMPGIRSGAQMAGQYGGSRQGIAEGIAAGNAQTGLNSQIANLYGGAYENAQNRSASTANNLAGLSLNNAQANAGRALSSDQFNANLGLQNNSQAMQNSQNNISNLQTGLNTLQAGNQLTDQTYGQQQGLLQAPSQYNQTGLGNYANIINQGSGMGGQSTQPYFTNPLGGALGGALGGLGLYKQLQGGSGGSSLMNYSTPGSNLYGSYGGSFGSGGNSFNIGPDIYGLNG